LYQIAIVGVDIDQSGCSTNRAATTNEQLKWC